MTPTKYVPLANALLVTVSTLVMASCKHANGDPAANASASGGAPVSTSAVASASTNDGRTSHAPMLPARSDTVVGATVHVTYTPATVIVDRTTLENTLRDVTDDGVTYTFDGSAASLDALHEGSVMLLQTYALRKVTAVHRDGSHLRVDTKPAALTDAISDGSIKWEHQVTFSRGALSTRGETAVSSSPAVSLAPAHNRSAWLDNIGDFLVPSLNAATPEAMATTGKIADYGYSLAYTPSDDRINVVVEVTKDVPSLELKLTGTGYLQNFANGGDIEISGGSLTMADFSNKQLNGEMNFAWEARTALGTGVADAFILRIPAAFRVPLIIGGIPFSIGIKTAFQIAPAFTTKQATAEGSFKVTFNGSEGFAMTTGNVTATGTVNTDPKVNDASSIFGAGVQGFTAAIQFPKIELGIGAIGTEAVGYVDIVTSAASITPGELGTRHCNKHTLIVSGKAGAVFSAFGLSLGEVKAPLFDKTVDRSVPEGANCEP
ncbi:MAG: hypothetical protein ABI311_15075 [Gemmatimonadaceae bacterium]